MPPEIVSTRQRPVKSSLFVFGEQSMILSYIPKKYRNVILISSMHDSDVIDEDTGDMKKPKGEMIEYNHKIRNLYALMQDRFQTEHVPGKVIVVDESMIPFQGRLLFKQYIPNKTHKYGVKVFKLCNNIGYTLQMSIYAGKNQPESGGVGLAQRVVMQLVDKYLDKGRILVTDNYYTSIPLATSLLERNTHLIGTLRKNRRDLPKDTMNKKIKQNAKGIVAGKWKDKREVFFLSTKHDLGMVDNGKK